MVPRVGQRIGPYEILGRLGSGGMGLVFSAWDARLQRDVAIKLLREEYATPTMRSRFLQEARAASGLNHANICTVFDIGEISGDPYLVMELLKGETLRAWISTRGKLAPEDIQRIASEVLDALAVAHARGVIHRDIKPANIILVNKPGGGFQAKVLDFGLAKMEMGQEESTHHDLTTLGTTVGTVSYMSPEQAKGEQIDARSDLFSLGSVLYEAATGELPFQGATSALIFVELLGKAPLPLRQQNPAIPKDLDRFITRLLAKNPADRFQSAKSALDVLSAVSMRKSAFDGMAIWGNKAAAGSSPAKSRPDPPSEKPVQETDDHRISDPRSSAGPALLAGSAPAARSLAEDAGTLRPGRRSVDPFLPHAATENDLLTDAQAAGSPEAPPNLPIAQAARPAPLPGSVVLRPVKPEPARSPLRDSVPPAPLDAANASSAVPDSSASPFLRAAQVPLAAAAGHEAVAAVSSAESDEPSDAAVPPSTRGGAPSTQRTSRFQPVWAWILAALLIPSLAAVSAWYLGWRHSITNGREPVSIVLAGMQNDTGDHPLGAVFSAGFEFDAAQSPRLSVRSAEDYARSLRATQRDAASEVSLEDARTAAGVAGIDALVFAEIHKDGASYDLSLRIVKAANGKLVSRISETASSREQLTQAVDRLTSDMRSALGESSDSIAESSLPLSKEATSNLEALENFKSGAALTAAGDQMEAILAFQRALGDDQHFTQAHLRLAKLYCAQHAELAAAQSAAQAQSSAANASPRTQILAQASYAIHASRDFTHATELLNHLLETRPGDLEVTIQLAQAQFLGGQFAEAQATAEKVLQVSRFDPEATEQEELALLAQGRFESVASLETQARTAGLFHPGIAALARAAGASATEMPLPLQVADLPPAIAAGLLDAEGHFDEGSARWHAMVDAARSTPELLSAAQFAYATAALNRALAGDCGTALAYTAQAQAQPGGVSGTFNAGEAEALCGDLDGARQSLAALTGSQGPGSATQNYLVPDLGATIAWKMGDTAGALRTLDAARSFDTISLTAYLRGMVQIAARQLPLSIVQFQTILSHRGPATLFNPEIYPLAQLGLARAYAASGDTANSSVAYGRFLQLWNTSDTGLSAVAEARSHAHP